MSQITIRASAAQVRAMNGALSYALASDEDECREITGAAPDVVARARDAVQKAMKANGVRP